MAHCSSNGGDAMLSASGNGAARFDGQLRQRTGAGAEDPYPSKFADYNCDRETVMSDHGAQSPGKGEVVSCRPELAWARKPSVLVPLFIAGAIAAAATPWLLSHTPNDKQAMAPQIDREDGALCAKFGFTRGANPNSDCKAALVDLRRRHELLLLY
jgi:hypothetical protein